MRGVVLGLVGLAACAPCQSPFQGAKAREECRYEAVKPLVTDEAALKQALDAIPDDTSRDLVLYRLAVDHPDRAARLCTLMRTDPARQQCEKVVGRPHLNGPK
jgi:hypothetical protein